jgi:hypothetical protein
MSGFGNRVKVEIDCAKACPSSNAEAITPGSLLSLKRFQRQENAPEMKFASP